MRRLAQSLSETFRTVSGSCGAPGKASLLEPGGPAKSRRRNLAAMASERYTLDPSPLTKTARLDSKKLSLTLLHAVQSSTAYHLSTPLSVRTNSSKFVIRTQGTRPRSERLFMPARRNLCRPQGFGSQSASENDLAPPARGPPSLAFSGLDPEYSLHHPDSSTTRDRASGDRAFRPVVRS